MGVELPPVQERDGNANHPFVMLCPAFLTARKGQNYLIDALKLLGERGIDAVVWLAGEGDMRQELEQQAARLSLTEKVVFLGQVRQQDLFELFRTSKIDALVLPSLHEGIPASLQEAMAHSIPVVSTAVGGTPEICADGAGILVPVRNAEALADAVEKLASDPSLRRQLAQAGRMMIDEQFNIEKVTDELLRHLDRIAHRQPVLKKDKAL